MLTNKGLAHRAEGWAWFREVPASLPPPRGMFVSIVNAELQGYSSERQMAQVWEAYLSVKLPSIGFSCKVSPTHLSACQAAKCRVDEKWCSTWPWGHSPRQPEALALLSKLQSQA